MRPSIALVGCLTLAVACEEDIPTAAAPPPAPTAAAAPAGDAAGGRALGSPSSALGGAKRAARNTADKIEDQQQKLLREMEKMEKGEAPSPP
jgi:hypothetical protein